MFGFIRAPKRLSFHDFLNQEDLKWVKKYVDKNGELLEEAIDMDILFAPTAIFQYKTADNFAAYVSSLRIKWHDANRTPEEREIIELQRKLKDLNKQLESFAILSVPGVTIKHSQGNHHGSTYTVTYSRTGWSANGRSLALAVHTILRKDAKLAAAVREMAEGDEDE